MANVYTAKIQRVGRVAPAGHVYGPQGTLVGMVAPGTGTSPSGLGRWWAWRTRRGDVPWARRRPWKLLLLLLHTSAELLAGRKTCQ